VGDPSILNKERLQVMYEHKGSVINPFIERFNKFDDPKMELADIFENNLTFAAYNLLKWKDGPMDLAPFQGVILEQLWNKTFPLFLASRGAGKSWLLAVYCILKAIMVPGSKIVIVASSFRQSKIIFDYCKQIHDYSPIVQQAVSKIHMPNDSCLMEINGGTSTIMAIPLGNGDKIRGIRSTDIIADEFASIPEEIFQVVVRGFAAVSADPVKQAKQIQIEDELIAKGVIKESDRKRIRSNKIVYSGTASYQFNHFYKLYTIHKAIIENRFIGDAKTINKSFNLDDEAKVDGHLDYRDYTIVQLPYTALPRGFMDEKQINQAFATMPKALFQMEYECQFPTDSDGFFKRSAINAATPGLKDDGAPFSVELRGQDNFEYVMGIDPARKTDNFAISILKLLPGKGAKNVYCWTMNNKSFVTCVQKIRELMSRFKIVRIAMDAGGGGYAVEDLLQNKELFSAGDTPVWRFDDDEQARFEGQHILEMVNFAASWLAESNYGLAADIEHKRLLFPFSTTDTKSDDIDEELIWEEIDEQIKEMCMIVVKPTKTGVQHFDLPDLPNSSQMSIKIEQRKDRYSALLLAAHAARTYVEQGQKTFSPLPGDWL
jgi:hypothetical protein